MEKIYDVIIVGSGPAGLTAAIYATRANLKTLVLAGVKWGGQLQLTSLVENFPGFPEGIQGPDLMTNIRKQAEHHGAEIVEKDFVSGDFNNKPLKITTEDGKSYESKSVILASGADARWLGVPGEEEKIGRGVSSCATCDAAFFRDKNVIVVGGGDSAMEEALVLSKSSTNVILVHRKNEFRASKIMQDRVKETKNIHIVFNSQITEVGGEFKVESVKLKTVPNDKSLLSKTNEELDKIHLRGLFTAKTLSKDESSITWQIPISGVFVAIGHIPNTKAFAGIELDELGYIKVQNHFHTNVPGVFVAGDVHDRQYRQAVTAAGFGSAAALEAEKWLAVQGGKV